MWSISTRPAPSRSLIVSATRSSRCTLRADRCKRIAALSTAFIWGPSSKQVLAIASGGSCELAQPCRTVWRSCAAHPGTDDVGCLAPAFSPQQVRRGHAAYLGVQVDAIQQRAGDPRLVALNLFRGAAAAPLAIAEVAAGAGIHRRHQLEACRIGDLVARPRQGNLPRFEWLPQHFQTVTAEFREFIQKQHPAVSERDFSRAWLAATAGQGSGTGAVMRRAERSLEKCICLHPAIVDVAQC